MPKDMDESLSRELEMHTTRVQSALEQVQKCLESSNQPGALASIQAVERELPLAAPFEPLRARIAGPKDQILKGMNQDEIYQAIYACYQNDDFEGVLALENWLFQSTPAPAAVANRIAAARRMDKIVRSALEQAEQALENDDWFAAFARLGEELRKFPANPRLGRGILSIGMTQSRREIAASLAAFEEHQFEPARRHSETALQVLERCLERHPDHELIGWHGRRARGLADVAARLVQAELQRASAHRQEALEELAQARHITATEEIEMPEVLESIAELDAILRREIDLIREEEAEFSEGERHLKEKDLQKAQASFNRLRAALLPQQQALAALRLAEAEEQMAEFYARLRQSQVQTDPEQAALEFTRACEIWPAGPGGLDGLIASLLKAGRACWERGEARKALFYARRVLILDPDCREAQTLERMPEAKKQGEALWLRSRQELERLRAQPLAANASIFQNLIAQIKDCLNDSGGLPELRLKLEHRLAEAELAEAVWQRFNEGYSAAQAARQAGRWDEAIEKLREVVQTFGDPAWQALRDLLQRWEKAAQSLRLAQSEIQTALQRGNTAYRALERPEDAGQALAELEAGLTAVRQAEQALNELEVSEFPADLGDLRDALVQTQARVSRTAEALRQPTAAARCQKLAAVMRADPEDAALAALEARLRQRAQVEVNLQLDEARRLSAQGRFEDALACCRLARAAQPDGQAPDGEAEALEQRLNLEWDLARLEDEAQRQAANGEHAAAQAGLQNGLRRLLALEDDLAPETRARLVELFHLGAEDDGQALADEEVWEHSQKHVRDLSRAGAGWVAQRAALLAQSWVRQARLAALQAREQACQQSGDLAGRYRALRGLLHAQPFHPGWARESLQAGQAWMNATHTTAARLLVQAEELLRQGQFQQASAGLIRLESESYGRLEREFPDLLEGDAQAVQNRQRGQKLILELENLQMLDQVAAPLLAQARSLCAAGEIERAEETLAQVNFDLEPLPFLKKVQQEVRQQIRAAQIQRAQIEFSQALHGGENGLIAARSQEDFAALVAQLEAIKQRSFFEWLGSSDHRRLNALLARAHKKRAELARGIEDERSAHEFLDLTPPDYIAAEWALKRALAVALDGQRQAILRRELDRIGPEARRQRGREEAVRRGQEALVNEQYRLARSELMRAQRDGAAVERWLKIAQVGLQFESIPAGGPQVETELNACLAQIAEIDLPEAEPLRMTIRGRLKPLDESHPTPIPPKPEPGEPDGDHL